MFCKKRFGWQKRASSRQQGGRRKKLTCLSNNWKVWGIRTPRHKTRLKEWRAIMTSSTNNIEKRMDCSNRWVLWQHFKSLKLGWVKTSCRNCRTERDCCQKGILLDQYLCHFVNLERWSCWVEAWIDGCNEPNGLSSKDCHWYREGATSSNAHSMFLTLSLGFAWRPARIRKGERRFKDTI